MVVIDTVKPIKKHPLVQQTLDLIAQSVSLRGEKRYEEALVRLDEAARVQPGFLPMLLEKGIVLFESGRRDEAVGCFDQILQSTSNSQVRELRDSCLKHALAECDRLLAEKRDDAQALVKRADILQRLRRQEEAVRDYSAALRIQVNELALTLNRRSNALLELNRPGEALDGYNYALELLPGNAALTFNRANVLQKLARMEEAVAGYDRALELKPDMAEAKMERSFCRLAAGDFERGFREFESRWETAQLKPGSSVSPQPRWLGEENLAGRSILLWAEQGYGDTIQFLRYVPLVARIAGATILRVPAGLKALAESVGCGVSVITTRDELPGHDFSCPLMSLPLAFGSGSSRSPRISHI